MNEFIVPPVGSKGLFKFKTPFNLEEYERMELEVLSIRSLRELSESGVDSSIMIYDPVGLTEDDFFEDNKNKIPIVVFKTCEAKMIYVPANRISSQPITDGVKYQEKILAISLGLVPLDFETSKIKEEIIAVVNKESGIKTTIEEVKGSGVVIVTNEEDLAFTKLLDGRKSQDDSWKTKYEKLKASYDNLNTVYTHLLDCVKSNLSKLKNPLKR